MSNITYTRREAAGLLLVGGVGLAFCGCTAAIPPLPLSPEWWLELHADGRICMRTTKVEMGQGAHTGLRTLVGEELDVDPAFILIEQLPSDPQYGEIITGGSYTLAGWFERMRRVGATARHMLMQAAARRWRVPLQEIATSDAQLLHPTSGRRAAYREFVAEAALAEPPSPAEVILKSRSSWRYIGKHGPLAHHEKMVTGAAAYGIDFRLPNMCYAVLARAPTLGARLVHFDDSAARRIPGFVTALALRGNAWPGLNHCRDAVAAVATHSWAAQCARDALRIEWDRGERAGQATADIFAVLEEHCSRPGVVSLLRAGDAPDQRGMRRLEAVYRQPYLAHAPMEPPNACASIRSGRMEVWCGNQRQTRLKDAIALELGLSPDDVTVHSTLLGGSFGRRLEIDYGLEAAKLTAALDRPVQVLWTRTDDIRHGLYRPGSVHRLAASLDRTGRLVSFEHRYAAESVFRQQEPQQLSPAGADWTLAAPLAAFFYDVPNARLEHHAVHPMTPCAWWRGTYWNNVTAAVECFMDELAELAGQDPLAFRLAHLMYESKRAFSVDEGMSIPFEAARMRRVLQVVAEESGWRKAPGAGAARGLACGIYAAPESYAAVAVEMALRDGAPTLTLATVAVDVGLAVNPHIVEAQAIGGFLMGASAALREQITWDVGEVSQRGFEDYAPLRMSDCPTVKIAIVPNDAPVSGVGELVTPASIAAVSNAASRLMGTRIRVWPILWTAGQARR